MNERIKELMGQTLDEKFAYTWSTMDIQDLKKFAERFAELIVKECIEINKQELAFNAFERLMDKYQEHLGVKE
jgi:hypothetical protein